MKAGFRQTLRDWAPPALRRIVWPVIARQGFSGHYRSWAEALAAAGSSYNNPIILERVLAATLAVRAGSAAYERDGVLFNNPAPDFPVLAALMLAAGTRSGRLRVLDFGGALGSAYWRHRTWLDSLAELKWDVVEQPHFVAAGRAHLQDTPLRFFSSIAEAQAVGGHDLLLASTSLQYLPDPPAMLRTWLAAEFPFLLFNNLPLHRGAPDRLAVQSVPRSIYPARYPVWFFNREGFFARLSDKYAVGAEFAAEAVWPVGWKQYPSTGLLLRHIIQ